MKVMAAKQRSIINDQNKSDKEVLIMDASMRKEEQKE
jgi:hypothetical protein